VSRSAPLAASVDLGSTLLKSAILREDGTLDVRLAVPAPPLRGAGDVREGDPWAYAQAADAVLADLERSLPCGTPLGLATQRSTFLLWDRSSGEPRSPLVSWQDRRAAGWCVRHRGVRTTIIERTGLVPTAHYVGPKLGALIEESAAWRDQLERPDTLLGTLDAWLLWRRTAGRVHTLDRTMAARTAMMDLTTGDWSDELLTLYGVRRTLLPAIRPTAGFAIPLDRGLVLRASIADQAAAVLPLCDEGGDVLVVTVGTGGFVLRPMTARRAAPPGYLLAPILALEDGATLWAHEGTVNGAGAAVDRFGAGPTELPAHDPTPDALCLPDIAGLGSPWWRPEIELVLSAAARALDRAAQRRIVLEGLLFRLRGIVDDLGGAPASRVVLVGGLAREPFVALGLAALLGRRVERLELPDAGLVGAARLAAGLPHCAPAEAVVVEQGDRGGYLEAKYGRWISWTNEIL
jgi:glycerol kinase